MTSDEFRTADSDATPPLASEASMALDPSADQELKRFARELRADPLRVLKARIRRSAVTNALKNQPGVVDVIPAGSLARGTQVGVVHDVDLIVVFDKDAHPEWHGPGSVGVALEHMQAMLADAFHGVPSVPEHDAEKERVPKVRIGPFGGAAQKALLSMDSPIDVVPAIRMGPHLRVPTRSDSGLRYEPWADVDPEKLMRMVAARKREWSNVSEVARLVKRWADHRQLGLNRLAVEILVLEYLRRPGISETVPCSDAIADFFRTAAQHIADDKIVGPRGIHTEIVPDLNYGRLRHALAESAILAQGAIDAERAWTAQRAGTPGGPLPARVIHPREYWQRLFAVGSIRRPTVWYYSSTSPETRPDPRLRRWFDERAEPADKTWSWTAEPSSLHNPADPGQKTRGESQQEGDDHLRRGVTRWKSRPRVRPDAFGVSRWSVASLSSKEGCLMPSGGRGDGPNGGDGQGMEPPAGGSGNEPEPQGRQRYLKCESPEDVPIGKPFSVLVSVVLGGSGGTALKLFDVPSAGTDVLLVAHAPGLRVLGDQRRVVHVPANSNSEPAMFELQAEASGRRRISITAWNGGTYLGELAVEVTAEHDSQAGRHRDTLTEIDTDPVEGAVSLVVRYDPRSNSYRFEFRDEDNPCEVTGSLAYEPGPQVEKLICNLDDLAKGRSGYSPGQVRDYLINAGADLWQQMVPPALREQFWERQHRIRQLTILADKDAVPWELLCPRDPGHDAGFLVDQFPVTRAIFGRKPARQIGLRPARFVLPDDSLPEARTEVDVMRQLLEVGPGGGEIISALTSLQELIRCADFGLLHFACHNQFSASDGSSIMLGNAKFTPTLLTTAVIDKVLEASAPTIFMNACRSAGLSATYSRLDGWASKFLEAGAGAFIGSLWAVSDGAAREFAQEFYTQLRAGYLLGEAVEQARKKAADQQDDPTWLAYTVYGDPRATVGGNFKCQSARGIRASNG